MGCSNGKRTRLASVLDDVHQRRSTAAAAEENNVRSVRNAVASLVSSQFFADWRHDEPDDVVPDVERQFLLELAIASRIRLRPGEDQLPLERTS